MVIHSGSYFHFQPKQFSEELLCFLLTVVNFLVSLVFLLLAIAGYYTIIVVLTKVTCYDYVPS